LILLALVAVEYTSRNAQTTAAESLVAKLKETEGTDKDIKSTDVKVAVGYKVPRVEDVTDKRLANGAKRLEIYEWFSVNPLKKRAMYVYYGVGEDPDVVSVSTVEETDTIAKRFPELTPEQKEEMIKKAAAGLKKPAVPQPDTAESAAAADKTPADNKGVEAETAKPPGNGNN
jgi:hypothetical protein